MLLMRLRLLRESGKKKLIIIPFIMTFANACLGLLSVLYAWDEQFMVAAYCIIAAAFFDGIDGRIARALGSTSSLGMELDSLCDAISFCAAPAIVLYSWKLHAATVLGLIVVGLYLCAGLFRLAKFNKSGTEQKLFFIGLPTPAAAASVVAFVIASEWLVKSRLYFLLKPYPFAILIGFIAFLMLSKVKFPSFKSRQATHASLVVAIAVIMAGMCALIFQKRQVYMLRLLS